MSTGKVTEHGMAQGISNKINYALTLMNSLSEMRDGSCVCDFTITIGVVTFEAHRAVLAASSAYFKAMITSDMKESAEGRTVLQGIEVGVFKHFLNYIYTGEAAVTEENCCSVLKAADMLQCDDLRDQCIQYLNENLIINNCLRVKATAEELSLTTLASHAEQFSVENFEEIVATKDFQALDFQDLVEFLRKSGGGYKIVWKAIMYWIRAEEERHEFLPEALDIIDLSECTFLFLYENVWAETLVREFEACNVKVAQAIFLAIKIEDVDQRNCFELLRAAQYKDPLLIDLLLIDGIEMIHRFMAREIKDVGQNPLFNELEKSDVTGIFEYIAFRSLDNWTPFVNWVNINKKRRKRHFISLLENSVGDSISFDFAFNTMLTEPIVKNSSKFTSVVIVISLREMDQQDVNPSNWFQLLHMAKTYKIPESERALKLTFDFLAVHFLEIGKQENFLKIQKDDLLRVLRVQYKSWSSQNSAVLWSTVCSWIKYENKSRSADLKDILKAIHLEESPFSHLFETIFSDPVIQASPQCEEIVVCAMFSALQYSDLRFENCFQLLVLARQHDNINSDRIDNEIHKYLSSHFEDICELEGFVNLKHTDVVRVLKTADVNCSEEVKWKSAIKWVKSDAENREKSLSCFLREIRLGKLPHDFLRNNIFAEELVKQSEECKTMIIEALFQKAENPVNSNPEPQRDTCVLRTVKPAPSSSQYRRGRRSRSRPPKTQYQTCYAYSQRQAQNLEAVSPASDHYRYMPSKSSIQHATSPRYPTQDRPYSVDHRSLVAHKQLPVRFQDNQPLSKVRAADQKRTVESEKEEQASNSRGYACLVMPK